MGFNISNISYQYYFPVALICNVTFMHENECRRTLWFHFQFTFYSSPKHWILCKLENKWKTPRHLLNLYLVWFELWGFEWASNWDKFRGSLVVVFVEVNSITEHVLGCSGCCRHGSQDIPKPGSRLSLTHYRWDTQSLCFSLGTTKGHSPAPSFGVVFYRQDWEVRTSWNMKRLPWKVIDHKKKMLLTSVPPRTLESKIQHFYLSLRKGRWRAFPYDYPSWDLLSSVRSHRGNECALYLFFCTEFFMIESHLQRRW